jgi:microcystin-dependent protein
MPARQYRSTVEPKTLSAGINNSVPTMIVNTATTLPNSFPYTLVIDPDTATEEIVTVSAASGTILTIARGQDGTSAQAHDAAAVIKHMVTARDLQEPQNHIYATSNIHGVTGSIAPLVSPTFTGTVVLPSSTSIGNVSSTEIGYLDGATSAIQTQLNTNTPVGMISPYAGSTPPTGWLLCDGAAVSRTTYASLFTITSTTYGVGDGTTTFNVPDLRGRVPMGAGTGTGLTARTLGSTLGVESVTLTAAQSGTTAHGHAVSSSTTLGDAGAQTATGSIVTGSHGHTLRVFWSGTTSHDHAIAGETNPLPAHRPDTSGGTSDNTNGTAIYAVGDLGGTASVSVGNHNHTTTTTTTLSNATAASAAEAHTNIQPSTVVNFIIKH